LIELADQLARLILVRGGAALGREEVRGERDEALERQTAGDVLDVRIEAAVLVDHDHAG